MFFLILLACVRCCVDATAGRRVVRTCLSVSTCQEFVEYNVSPSEKIKKTFQSCFLANGISHYAMRDTGQS